MERALTAYEFGWVVGILEGEGCFGGFNTPRGPQRPYLRVNVVSTDREILDRLQEMLGGSICVHGKPHPNWKKSWRWTLAKQGSVLPLMEAIAPLMSPRRAERIRELLHLSTGVENAGDTVVVLA